MRHEHDTMVFMMAYRNRKSWGKHSGRCFDATKYILSMTLNLILSPVHASPSTASYETTYSLLPKPSGPTPRGWSSGFLIR